MPWSASDSVRHNKSLEGDQHMQETWATVANRVLAHTGDEGSAVKIANSVVKHHPKSGDQKAEDPRDRYLHWSKK